MKNKYSEEILKNLRELNGLESIDKSKDALFFAMKLHDVLDLMLTFEGILGYSDKIKCWIEDIYDIKLLNKTIKPYYFMLKIHHYRTNEILGIKTGAVFAENKEEATNIAIEKYGSKYTSSIYIEKISDDGFQFTVYKCNIN